MGELAKDETVKEENAGAPKFPQSYALWIQSPSLAKVTPKIYSDESSHGNARKLAFFPRANPAWFAPGFPQDGRVYEIPSAPSGHNWGLVIVDDARNIVYIYVVWS